MSEETSILRRNQVQWIDQLINKWRALAEHGMITETAAEAKIESLQTIRSRLTDGLEDLSQIDLNVIRSAIQQHETSLKSYPKKESRV